MEANLTRLVKLALFACLALTLYKGVVKIPEVATTLYPERFYRGLVSDAENSLIMKERHYDFNHETKKALELRLPEQQRANPAVDPGSLVTPERVIRAIGKATAKDVRNADYVLLAQEALARAKRLKAEGWRMGVMSCEPWSGWPAKAGKP